MKHISTHRRERILSKPLCHSLVRAPPSGILYKLEAAVTSIAEDRGRPQMRSAVLLCKHEPEFFAIQNT